MTVVLRDSIQTKPLPIANAIIHVAVTRLVTAFGNRGIFSISSASKANSAILALSPVVGVVIRVFQQKDAEPSIAGKMADVGQFLLLWSMRTHPSVQGLPTCRISAGTMARAIG